MFAPFTTTGIGSLPFIDPEEAASFSLQACDIPFWPQLPKVSFRELMVPQYSEGLPGVRIDRDSERVTVEPVSQDDLNSFYEKVGEDADFPISREYAQGFYAFMAELERTGKRFPCLKGQITGPLTFTLSIKLSDGRYLYFDDEMREIATMLLQRKAIWQIKELSRHAERVLIFIDEPILTAIGSSSYLGVEPEEAERLLRETVSAIRSSGGIAGIHSCGRADWGMLMRTGADIINFDAYDYFDNLMIYKEQIQEFFERGGYLAWGIVPTTDAIREVESSNVREMLIKEFELLSETIPLKKIYENALLTPSCGAGSRTVEEAGKVFSILKELAGELKG
ncbi:MAG: hypothetical protein GXO97_05405 [Nitrospirae bacterium]|nr:hypothetical protein [Nitrospirota bacterium]